MSWSCDKAGAGRGWWSPYQSLGAVPLSRSRSTSRRRQGRPPRGTIFFLRWVRIVDSPSLALTHAVALTLTLALAFALTLALAFALTLALAFALALTLTLAPPLRVMPD